MGKITKGLFILGGLVGANVVQAVAFALLSADTEKNKFIAGASTALTAMDILLMPPLYAFSSLQHNGILEPWHHAITTTTITNEEKQTAKTATAHLKDHTL